MDDKIKDFMMGLQEKELIFVSFITFTLVEADQSVDQCSNFVQNLFFQLHSSNTLTQQIAHIYQVMDLNACKPIR